MWHEKQLRTGKGGCEETETLEQKTVVVSIPHSENRNFTQDYNRQGDEACMDTQRDFLQDL